MQDDGIISKDSVHEDGPDPLPSSPHYRLDNTPSSGRGLFAKRNIPNGTLILSTTAASSEPLSPSYHAILRLYRKEVCAECFRYDRGREWKLKIGSKDGVAETLVSQCTAQHVENKDAGVVFCSEACRSKFIIRYGAVGIQAFRNLESCLQRLSKRASSHNTAGEVDTTTQMPLDHSTDSITTGWKEPAQIGQRIIQSRAMPRPSKSARKLLDFAGEARNVNPDILYALITGVLNSYLSTQPKPHPEVFRDDFHHLHSITTLAADPKCYDNPTSTLDAYIAAYHLLLTVLPHPLLPYLTTSLAHDICARAHHNAFSIRPSEDGDQSGEFLGWGVWPEASFFNHSCAPNVAKHRTGRVWQFKVDKEDGIQAGVELCITYLGGEEKTMTVTERKSRLKTEWDFECTCARCLREAIDCGDMVTTVNE